MDRNFMEWEFCKQGLECCIGLKNCSLGVSIIVNNLLLLLLLLFALKDSHIIKQFRSKES